MGLGLTVAVEVHLLGLIQCKQEALLMAKSPLAAPVGPPATRTGLVFVVRQILPSSLKSLLVVSSCENKSVLCHTLALNVRETPILPSLGKAIIITDHVAQPREYDGYVV